MDGQVKLGTTDIVRVFRSPSDCASSMKLESRSMALPGRGSSRGERYPRSIFLAVSAGLGKRPVVLAMAKHGQKLPAQMLRVSQLLASRTLCDLQILNPKSEWG